MRNRSTGAVEKKYRDYFAICEAVSILLHPYGEVVLHDISTGKIVRIWNAFSKRKAGDPSHLEGVSDLFTDERILGPYEKALPSHGRTKSMTAALYDADGQIAGYFCVNVDVTALDTVMGRMAAFTSPQTSRPPTIYRNDLQQHINYVVRDYLLAINKTFESLTPAERVKLVAALDESGLFQARNAMKLVANTLGISRASVYNLLAKAKGRAQNAGGASRIAAATAAAANQARHTQARQTKSDRAS